MTPSQLKTMPWEETRKICYDYTIAGLETIAQLPRNAAGTPLRFLYTSGAKTVRDPSQKPWILGDYSLMRVCPLTSFAWCHLITPGHNIKVISIGRSRSPRP